MQCRICGREGASHTGFHTACFTRTVERNAGVDPEYKRREEKKQESSKREQTEQEWEAYRRYKAAREEEQRKWNDPVEKEKRRQEWEAKERQRLTEEEERRRAYDAQRQAEEQARRQQGQSQQRPPWENDFHRIFEEQFRYGSAGSAGRGFRPGPTVNTGTAQAAGVTVVIDAARLKQLLLLCHPDKHGNSERSTEVTRWLIGIKEKLR